MLDKIWYKTNDYLSNSLELFKNVYAFIYLQNIIYLSFLALSTDKAADVSVHKCEGLSQQGAHVGHPHDEDWHPEGGIDHRHYPTPLSLWSNISITYKH